MYRSPAAYLNGTAPLNVTGYVNQCNSNGTECVLTQSPDSYLWYDELHPSEQADPIVASEFVKMVQGHSQYSKYWS
jgi:phospholipase/lecithinase/hemolysin